MVASCSCNSNLDSLLLFNKYDIFFLLKSTFHAFEIMQNVWCVAYTQFVRQSGHQEWHLAYKRITADTIGRARVPLPSPSSSLANTMASGSNCALEFYVIVHQLFKTMTFILSSMQKFPMNLLFHVAYFWDMESWIWLTWKTSCFPLAVMSLGSNQGVKFNGAFLYFSRAW